MALKRSSFVPGALTISKLETLNSNQSVLGFQNEDTHMVHHQSQEQLYPVSAPTLDKNIVGDFS